MSGRFCVFLLYVHDHCDICQFLNCVYDDVGTDVK